MTGRVTQTFAEPAYVDAGEARVGQMVVEVVRDVGDQDAPQIAARVSQMLIEVLGDKDSPTLEGLATQMVLELVRSEAQAPIVRCPPVFDPSENIGLVEPFAEGSVSCDTIYFTTSDDSCTNGFTTSDDSCDDGFSPSSGGQTSAFDPSSEGFAPCDDC